MIKASNINGNPPELSPSPQQISSENAALEVFLKG
jgi:hypothetical protein